MGELPRQGQGPQPMQHRVVGSIDQLSVRVGPSSQGHHVTPSQPVGVEAAGDQLGSGESPTAKCRGKFARNSHTFHCGWDSGAARSKVCWVCRPRESGAAAGRLCKTLCGAPLPGLLAQQATLSGRSSSPDSRPGRRMLSLRPSGRDARGEAPHIQHSRGIAGKPSTASREETAARLGACSHRNAHESPASK